MDEDFIKQPILKLYTKLKGNTNGIETKHADESGQRTCTAQKDNDVPYKRHNDTVKNHIGMGVLDMLSPKLEEIFFVEFEKRIKKVMSSKLKTKFKRFGVATGLFKKRESCESPALKRCLGIIQLMYTGLGSRQIF